MPAINYCGSHCGAIACEQDIDLPAWQMEALFAALARILIDALEFQGIFAKLFKLMANVVHHIVMTLARQRRDLQAAHGDGCIDDVNKGFLGGGAERMADYSRNNILGVVQCSGGIHGLNVHIMFY
ncbi:hypothetical protein D3C80_1066450 [compost metagenome]